MDKLLRIIYENENHEEVIEIIKNTTCDINENIRSSCSQTMSYTILEACLSKGYSVKFIEYLISKGAKVVRPNIANEWCYEHRINKKPYGDNVELVKYGNLSSPAIQIAIKNHIYKDKELIKILKILIREGASVDINKSGFATHYNSLDYAIYRGYSYKVIKLLMDNGAVSYEYTDYKRNL